MVEENKTPTKIEENKETKDQVPDQNRLFTFDAFAQKVSKNEQLQLYSKKFLDYVDVAKDFIVYKESKRQDRNEVVQSARGPILFGFWTIFVTIGIGGLWSAIAPLDSASHTMGSVVFETSRKTIQHLEGGIIDKIFVKDGDTVKAGQELIKLNDTSAKANFQINQGQLRAAKAVEARLIAERDEIKEVEKIPFDEELLLKHESDPEVSKILNTQRNLFKARTATFQGQLEVLNKTLESLKLQEKANAQQLQILGDQLASAKKLLEKGHDRLTRVQELQRVVADLEGKKGYYLGQIAETEIKIYNIKSDNLSKITAELKETQVQVGDLQERYIAAKDVLERTTITSPVNGKITNLKYHTIGGVIGREQPIMEIAPENDKLIVEARIKPEDIDVVHEGMKSNIKFTAFKARRVPGATGKVIHVSADRVEDRANPQMPFYFVARIEIDNAEKFEKKYAVQIYPGMNVDVMIVNGERTLLQYLLDPVLDTMRYSFKEK
jgi:HlyD family type I secretion membrane fusion protein